MLVDSIKEEFERAAPHDGVALNVQMSAGNFRLGSGEAKESPLFLGRRSGPYRSPPPPHCVRDFSTEECDEGQSRSPDEA